jgi:hypothetical protein
MNTLRNNDNPQNVVQLPTHTIQDADQMWDEENALSLRETEYSSDSLIHLRQRCDDMGMHLKTGKTVRGTSFVTISTFESLSDLVFTLSADKAYSNIIVQGLESDCVAQAHLCLNEYMLARSKANIEAVRNLPQLPIGSTLALPDYSDAEVAEARELAL